MMIIATCASPFYWTLYYIEMLYLPTSRIILYSNVKYKKLMLY